MAANMFSAIDIMWWKAISQYVFSSHSTTKMSPRSAKTTISAGADVANYIVPTNWRSDFLDLGI